MTNNLRVPFFRVSVRAPDRRAVLKALGSANITTGAELERFEKAVAEYIGVKHVVALNGGTACLKIALIAVGVGPGDEVITAGFTHHSTVTAILAAGATPVFADVDPLTLNIDPASVERIISHRTRAVLPVHIFGTIGQMPSIEEIRSKHGLSVVEDACEAFGSVAYGKKAGSFGNAAAFSFHPMKVVTTAEGGALVTNDDRIASFAKQFRCQEVIEVGTRRVIGEGGKLSSFNCALGLSQMDRVERTVAERVRIAERYYKLLKGMEGIRLLGALSGEQRVSWFQFPVILDERFGKEDRDRLIDGLQREGIQAASAFSPFDIASRFSFLGYQPGACPEAERLSERVVMLPFFTSMRLEEQRFVCDKLKKSLARY